MCMRRYKLKRLYLLILLPINFLLRAFAKASPQFIERHYSQGVYPIFASSFNLITSIFSFSIAEIIIVIVVVYGIVFVIKSSLKILSLEGEERKYELYIIAVNILVAVSIILFTTTVSFGLNYHRIPFVDTIGLDVSKYTDEDLYELTVTLISDSNKYRGYVKEDENGIMCLSRDVHETADFARQAMNKVSHSYSNLYGMYQQPKPIKASRFLSKLGITGFFFPITFEANVNVDAPDYGIPFTMMHELSHVRGYMQEEEANFIAYLSCMSGDDEEFKYSASMEALIYALNALYKTDEDLYLKACINLSEKVINDKNSRNEYWNKFDGSTRRLADSANDIYLKANDQESGMNSYGQLVDLLIAYNKAKI